MESLKNLVFLCLLIPSIFLLKFGIEGGSLKEVIGGFSLIGGVALIATMVIRSIEKQKYSNYIPYKPKEEYEVESNFPPPDEPVTHTGCVCGTCGRTLGKGGNCRWCER